MTEPFLFLDPGPLEDGELELFVLKQMPAQPEKGYVPAYEFWLFVAGQQVGRLNLRAQTTPALEAVGGHIGYEVFAPFRGQRYAERACRLVLPFAKRIGLHAVVLTCDPDNRASYRTIERLGANYMGIVDVPPDHEMYRQGDRQKRRYVLPLA